MGSLGCRKELVWDRVARCLHPGGQHEGTGPAGDYLISQLTIVDEETSIVAQILKGDLGEPPI